MPLYIACPKCGSQFKAPDRVAGRTVRCLKCKAGIVVPAAQPIPAALSAPLPAAEPMVVDGGPRPTPWLTVLLFTGMGIAFFLVIALLVIVLNKEPGGPRVAATKSKPSAPPDVEWEPAAPAPAEPAPEVKTPLSEVKPPAEAKPALPDRAERLAALEAQEKETVAALQEKAEKHKSALQKLRRDEDALFPKGKLNAGQMAKLRARTDLFAKEQAAVVRAAIKDVMAVHRQREEILQARRKLLFDHPEAGDVKLDTYNGMLLTADELKDVIKREATAGTPRAAALPYVQGEELQTVLKGTYYAGTYQDPGVEDVAAIVYRVGSYRDKSDMQVHVFLYRQRGVWRVLELPGRTNTVYVGTPASEFKPMDSGS